MTQRAWRIATRRRGRSDWDIGLTTFTKATAQIAARQFNRLYREYEHKPVNVKSGRMK